MNREGTRNSQAFFDDYLRTIRQQFFPDDPKAFAQQKPFFVQAIAYPLEFLNDRGVWLPEKRLRQILNEVITGIKQHGTTDKIRFFGGYLLNCVQKHMRHHDEAYYNEGKTARSKPVSSMNWDASLKRLHIGEETPAQFADEVLAIAAAIKAGPKRKKAAKPASQPTLF
jgi:hypothetical protein